MNLFLMSLKNIFRHKRRAIITVSAICFGVMVILFFGGFITALKDAMIDYLIRSQTGNLQIHYQGYVESSKLSPYEYLIGDYEQIKKEIQNIPEVQSFSSRMKFGGLISNGPNSAPFMGFGIEPEAELNVSANKIKEDMIIQGEYFGPNDEKSILIGEGLAKGLKAKPGDQLTIVVNTKYDSVNAENVTVKGIVRIGQAEIDNTLIYADMGMVQNLLQLDGEVTEVVILLKQITHTHPVHERLQQIIREQQLPLEVHTWEQLGSTFVGVLDVFGRAFAIISIILFIVITLGIMNTMIMSVFERVREIGMMMSMGMNMWDIIFVFTTEAFLMGVIGAISGLVIGSILLTIVGSVGIVINPPGFSGKMPLIRPGIQTFYALFGFGFAMVVSIVSSLYPSFSAGRMKPVEAIRFS